MPAHSLTQVLNAYHNKLDEHTTDIQKLEAEIKQVTESVTQLEAKLSKMGESSGLRASMRDWLANIRELM